MGVRPDGNGRFHDDDGRFVSLRSYVERIFDEREKATEFARATLERALLEAKATTERALAEARGTTEKALVEAKTAADEVNKVMQGRIVSLESGGAPFASRLDESLTALKTDVEVLKDNMVRTTVLDALREQGALEVKQQRKQIKYIMITAGVSFVLSLVLMAVQLL